MIKFIALGEIIQDKQFLVEYCICVKERSITVQVTVYFFSSFLTILFLKNTLQIKIKYLNYFKSQLLNNIKTIKCDRNILFY